MNTPPISATGSDYSWLRVLKWLCSRRFSLDCSCWAANACYACALRRGLSGLRWPGRLATGGSSALQSPAFLPTGFRVGDRESCPQACELDRTSTLASSHFTGHEPIKTARRALGQIDQGIVRCFARPQNGRGIENARAPYQPS